ncbi:MAG: hypothetical protein K8H86_02900, partial [Ignavibacteriaceae bacterium]|nr:hypothetical protein [Ignavibacteriaceae bacterium]
MILFAESPTSNIIQSDVAAMKNLGVDIIHHANVTDDMIDRFVQNGLKAMPYQNWTTNNYIYQYTGAHYTEWEAEGTPPGKGNVTLEYKSAIATLDSEDGILGIKTIPDALAGNLITGPGYRQDGHKRYHPEDPIIYQADFELKIKPTDPNINLFDPQYKDVEVCILAVVTHEVISNRENGTMYVSEIPMKTYKETLTIEDFVDYEYHPHTLSNIDWIGGGVSPITQDNYWKEEIEYEGQYVQFIVDWAGSDLLQLYVDKISVSDDMGRRLLQPSSPAVVEISSEINSLVNTDGIEIYYSSDEPTSIDNYEPYRMVDSMVFAITGNKRIITSLNTNYNGKYGPTGLPFGSYQYYVGEEFWKRAKPLFLWLNAYPYHYYWKPTEGNPNWREDNINLQIEKIKNVSKNDPNWGQDIQCTKWTVIDKNCLQEEHLISPTVEMMLYSTNLALLYGAKTIGFYEYFSLRNTDCNILYADGLVDENGTPNDRYYTIQNTIAPRLSGLMGKTLKNIIPIKQRNNLDLPYAPVVDYSFINKVEAINYSEATNYFLDLGFFEDEVPADKYYSFAINRYYSTLNEIQYTFQNPNSFYKNYRLKNLIDSTSTDINLTSNFEYSTTIEKGDAHFIRLTPA